VALVGTQRISLRGDWPGPLTLRRGWSRGVARPWNDQHPEAALRLERGSAAFLADCTAALGELGVPGVFSPPLPASGQRIWAGAGYVVHVPLALMRAELDRSLPTPDHLVVAGSAVDLDAILAIDRAAFSPFWRFDIHGMTESLEATSNSSLLLIKGRDGTPAGYAITGVGHAIAYLQRVAVHPDWQGHGMGRSLVRAAARSTRSAGARAILLNTQFENVGAARLYESEGYTVLPEPLAVMRADTPRPG
jgi:ribosomal protein S18 acetylase RimI-like enzyme